jgi:DNA-binding NarL/FixJ family response regulator
MQKRRPTVRVLIADDHPIFRDGLRHLLEAHAKFRVVGEAGDGAEAVKLARQLKPDILLLDLAMPKVAGREVLQELAASALPVRTIVLAAAAKRRQILEALVLGAQGVVLKKSATRLLLKSIRSVMAGQYWVGRESVSDLVKALREYMPPPVPQGRPKTFGLTPRELEVVAVVVAGYTNKEIAQKFSISEQTVKHHLSKIFDKLGVSNRLELALFAISHHLIDKL